MNSRSFYIVEAQKCKKKLNYPNKKLKDLSRMYDIFIPQDFISNKSCLGNIHLQIRRIKFYEALSFL